MTSIFFCICFANPSDLLFMALIVSAGTSGIALLPRDAAEVDILDNIFLLSPEALNILLKDHTTSKEDSRRNIFWTTFDYEHPDGIKGVVPDSCNDRREVVADLFGTR